MANLNALNNWQGLNQPYKRLREPIHVWVAALDDTVLGIYINGSNAEKAVREHYRIYYTPMGEVDYKDTRSVLVDARWRGLNYSIFPMIVEE